MKELDRNTLVWLTLTASPLVSIVASHSTRGSAESGRGRPDRGGDRDAGPVNLCLRTAAFVWRDDQLHRAHCAPDADIVRRTPSLSFIDLSEVLVFARFGRSEAEGAFATCHCLTPARRASLATTSGAIATRAQLTRRSEWFVTKSPVVRLGDAADQLPDLVRRCRASAIRRSQRSRKEELYPGAPSLAREARHDRARALSHRSRGVRDPAHRARRRQRLVRCARPAVLTSTWPEWCRPISRSAPDPAMYEFLQRRLRRARRAVRRRRGDDVPEFPVVSAALHRTAASMPAAPTRSVRVEPLKPLTQPVRYTEDDLHIRQFTGSRHEPRRLAKASGVRPKLTADS